ncbi:MAG: family 10 glycosylhydrolase, partial [Clostridia bacterium]|nr:family 10 glycosylhydrolase [Clostridia bacterium]
MIQGIWMWPNNIHKYGAKKIFSVLKSARFTDVYLLTKGLSGKTSFIGKTAPAAFDRDILKEVIDIAHLYGIRVHAWIMCFTGTRGSASCMQLFAKKGWRIRNKKGELTEYLAPSNAELQQYLLSAIEELTLKYPVHGVHLDFVRWYEGAKLPKNATKPVGQFVTRARMKVKCARPSVFFSTAVFGKYPSCVAAIGQDWQSWLDAGIVDWMVPMNYIEDNSKYTALIKQQCQYPS